MGNEGEPRASLTGVHVDRRTDFLVGPVECDIIPSTTSLLMQVFGCGSAKAPFVRLPFRFLALLLCPKRLGRKKSWIETESNPESMIGIDATVAQALQTQVHSIERRRNGPTHLRSILDLFDTLVYRDEQLLAERTEGPSFVMVCGL